MSNILITSAGKRVKLVILFKQTLISSGLESKVYTTDMNPTLAPAGRVSDGCFAVPRVTDSSYVDILLKLCIQYDIKIIIPTIDTELLILARHKKLFQKNGIEPVVSDTEFVSICRDKRNTGKYFVDHGIKIPEPIDKYHPRFPLFAKPYDGSLSQDIHIIHSAEELTQELLNHPKLMFMEYIDKKFFKEFTVDMYYGKDHKVKGIVPRERLEIRAGEINKGITRKNDLLRLLKTRMNYLPGVVGCICIQLFYNEMKNEVFAIEINPRFGGGYPLSYAAGANFLKNIISEYINHESLEYDESWKDNTLMLRYDDDIITFDAKL